MKTETCLSTSWFVTATQTYEKMIQQNAASVRMHKVVADVSQFLIVTLNVRVLLQCWQWYLALQKWAIDNASVLFCWIEKVEKKDENPVEEQSND